jgi:hypothetical protein
VKARFDVPGLFVWHCHILSHEDNEMMRAYCVGDPKACAVTVGRERSSATRLAPEGGKSHVTSSAATK